MKTGALCRFHAESEKGFTLLELLIALALLTILLGALYSTFFMSQKALNGVDDTLLKLQECRMTIDTIGREMDSLLYSRSNRSTAFRIEDRDIYGRQTSKFSFTTFSPLTPGLSAVTYYVEEKEGKMTLIKKMRSAFIPEKPDDKGVELVEDIREFAVEAKIKDAWVRTWDASETNVVPDELRVTITFMLKDKPFTLYETINPKLGTAI